MSLSRKSEEEHNSPSDEALEEVNQHVREAFNILKRETNKVRKEKEAFDEVAKKLEHIHFSKMLKLNVGGHRFDTSLETMNKDPGSMLHAMFSGRFDTKPGEDGSYFIDRDGTHFRHILNYLRTGKLMLPDDKIVRNELLTEAEFYQIEGIIEDLRARPFKTSTILSSEQRQQLIDLLKETIESASDDYVLLYRASQNGWTAANFHSCCDGKGPTVTVIKSGNYVFGGYTEEQWDQPAGGANYKKAPESFLFSLVNPNSLPPSKLPLITGKEGNAIHCHNGYGPTFGSGHDLRIVSAPNSNNCSVSLNNSYQCPTGQNAATFLQGNQNFTISEMEMSSKRIPKKELPDDEALDEVNKHIKDAFDILKHTVLYKRAPGSFLFSLVNASGLPPTKLPLVVGKEEKAISCYSNNGPIFGGNDLSITNSPNSNLCTVNLNNKYQCPVGQNDTASYKRAPGSFLFSLVNASGLPPAKMPLIDGKEGNAIYCYSSYGPVFGGPTVTVIKSGNYIFGGYTEQPWQSSNTALHKRAPGSFLFSLANASGLPPTKMPLIDGQEGKAIFCYSGNGPVFGGGNDLNICCSPNSSNCSVNLGNTYQCPVGQNGHYFLTGSQYFTVSEMEVFVFEN
ncbi:hypothetical protein pdam_00008503 [Pocillopora damicornis]|uniref:TLDc domain-containing protein n=1 Tax=Pocillopora damicornis TaxID=46731 RepID=A0A3M6U4G2_POCDA|nr:hypothetical protein pdam_00008503 [Pocillopora damicornis]